MITLPYRKFRFFDMTLLIILGLVFAGVALMVVFGERFGKPMEPEQQQKLSRVATILVFVLIIVGVLKLAFA